jgi:hypothetical protein
MKPTRCAVGTNTRHSGDFPTIIRNPICGHLCVPPGVAEGLVLSLQFEFAGVFGASGGEGGIATPFTETQRNQAFIASPRMPCVPVLCPEVDGICSIHCAILIAASITGPLNAPI